MKSKSLKILGFLSVFTALLLFGNLDKVEASDQHNLRGVAYNNNGLGYISFNCLDDGYAGNFPFQFPFPFNIPPCFSSSYGANLDSDNTFSGSAWSSSVGFIDFDSASSTPEDDFRDNCENCPIGFCTACYDEENGDVYGYMRIRNTGEWIKLHGLPNPVQITNYNTSEPGIFSGYALAPSPYGTISFNCTNENTCKPLGDNDYRVKIGPLEIRQLTAPNWGSEEACGNLGAKKAVLKWNRRSGIQKWYQVIVSTANSTSSEIVYNSGQVEAPFASQVMVDLPLYNTPYYWFLKVWDSLGSSTPWRQFNTYNTKDVLTHNSAKNTQKNLVDPTKTFTSYIHDFPKPLFTYSPEEIVIATTSNSFVSNSSYYNNSNTLTPCPSGSVCTYQWSVTYPEVNTVSYPSLASTSIMFTKATNTAITLSVTDDAIYTCSTSTTINVNYALPIWKEIKPETQP